MLKLVILLLSVALACAIPINQFNSYFDNEGLVDGDMKMTQEEHDFYKGKSIHSKTGRLDPAYRWAKHGELVLVPYNFNETAGFTLADINVILRDFAAIERGTCIRMIPWSNEVNYIDIISDTGCWSWVGGGRGRQELSLRRNGCVYEGTVSHEVIHALGYQHMHTSYDRDEYVSIYMDNVQAGHEHNFDKVNPNAYNNFGTTYDFYSVMHYSRSAFGIDRQDTIIPHDPFYLDIMGQNTLSVGDYARLNNMYECHDLK